MRQFTGPATRFAQPFRKAPSASVSVDNFTPRGVPPDADPFDAPPDHGGRPHGRRVCRVRLIRAGALDTSAPVLTPREVTDFSVTYDVEISASSNKARTRWQAVLKVEDGEGKDRSGVNYTDWSTDQEDRWTWVGGAETIPPDRTSRSSASN